MHSALDDLKLDQLFIVYPRNEVLPLPMLLKRFRKRGSSRARRKADV